MIRLKLVTLLVVSAVVALAGCGSGVKPDGPVATYVPPPSSSVQVPPSATGSSTSVTTTIVAPGGTVLGTPLQGPDAPDGVVVTRSYDTFVDDNTIVINGVKASYAFGGYCSVACGSSSEASLTLNLGRQFSKLEMHVGATDKSKSSTEAVRIQIISLDGGQSVSRFDKSFTVGQAENVSLDVSNVLQLKFVFSGDLLRVYGGVGDPTGFK